MFDKKHKYCVKQIHLVTDDGFLLQKAFSKINNFPYSSFMKDDNLSIIYLHSVSSSIPTKSPGCPGSEPIHFTVPRDSRPLALLTLTFISNFKSFEIVGQNGARMFLEISGEKQP